MLKSPNGRPAIISFSGLPVTSSNQDDTTTRLDNLFQGKRRQKHTTNDQT